jgi:hypothetical protein
MGDWEAFDEYLWGRGVREVADKVEKSGARRWGSAIRNSAKERKGRESDEDMIVPSFVLLRDCRASWHKLSIIVFHKVCERHETRTK